MPGYRKCKECQQLFTVDLHCTWHQRGTCGRVCYDLRKANYKKPGPKPGTVDKRSAAVDLEIKFSVTGNRPLRREFAILPTMLFVSELPLAHAQRKAEIDLRHTPSGVYPDGETPEAERLARAKCGDDVMTGKGVGSVREFNRASFRKTKKPAD